MPTMAPPQPICVKTIHLGEVTVQEDELIVFVGPILGFDGLRRFHRYQLHPGAVWLLQSIEDPAVCFSTMAPFEAGLDPDIEIGAEDAADIDATGEQDIQVLTTLVLDHDPAKMCTNLRAPILIGKRSLKAKQIVLTNPKLSLRTSIADIPRARRA